MPYDATNLGTLDAAKPTALEDAGQTDEILRETRTIFKAVLEQLFNGDDTLKTELFNTSQLIDNAVTAAKLNDDTAGDGLARNAITKALDLLFDADVFILDGSGKLTLKPGVDLTDFTTAISELALTSITHGDVAGKVVMSDASGGLILQSITGGLALSPTGVATLNAGLANILIFETAGPNTGTGSLTAATWTTRDSLVKQLDSSNLATVSGSTFTLQPGFTYLLDIRVPAYGVNGHIARLWNETDGAVVVNGTTSYTGSAGGSDAAMDFSEIFATITISDVPKTYKIQSIAESTFADTRARGRPANVGIAEVFTRISIFVGSTGA